MARRIALYFDGTWQTLSQDAPTHIARLARATALTGADGAAQLVWYHPGVGADPATGARNRRAGALGTGLETSLFDAQRFLILNATAGDQLFVFGFSRGAWAARSLAGWLGACGLGQRDQAQDLAASWRAYRAGGPAARSMRRSVGGPRAVRFLGCFDTVGRLGVPDLLPGVPMDLALNAGRRFHTVRPGGHVRTVRHACALDETRRAFALTPMLADRPGRDLEERWFIGPHGAVGGGEAVHRPLGDIALDWMARQASKAGLDIDFNALDLQPDPTGPIRQPGGMLAWLGRAPRRHAAQARPDQIDESVRARMAAIPGYRPAALA